MSGKLDGLQSRVGSVMRLARARGLTLAAAVAALVMGGAFLAASVFDIAFRLSAPSRFVLLLGSIGFALWAAVRARRGAPSDDASAAREVERSFPEIESSLSTAIEYGSDPVKTEAFSSREIVDGLVDSTAERTAPLPFRRAVDWRAVGRAAAGAAAAGVLVLVYALLLPHMARSTAARFWNPFSDAPPPTWTVILSVDPGNREVPRGEGVAVRAVLDGRRPDSVQVFYRGAGDEEWLASNMSADMESGAESGEGDRVFSRTLRVVRKTEYRVVAGDAESATFRLWPVEPPRVEAIRVRVAPPAYTGLAAEDLPEGTGDVRALEGSRVEVSIRTNRKVERAELELSLGDGKEPPRTVSVPLEAPPAKEGDDATPERAAGEPGDDLADDLAGEFDGEDLVASFELAESGEYRVSLADSAGRTNSGDASYRLTAVPDRAPVVRILKPDKDVSAHKAQDVTIEIEATDDYGIAEVGIVDTLTGKPISRSVESPAAGTKRAEGKYPLRLSLAGLKGGEIVTYYPYAVDSKGTRTKGDVRFLHTYDEERYGGMPGEQQPRPPRAVREVERLVERQQDLTRDTFSAARGAEDEKGKVAAGARSAREQDDVKRDLDELVKEVEQELESAAPPEGAPAADPLGMRPEELDLMKHASERMGAASGSLGEGQMDAATAPQSEALSDLSRTRRILLSQNASSSSTSRALEQAGERREQEREQKRRQNLDQLREEMRKLPPMLEREKRERRKLEQLEDEPPPPGQAGQMADEQRRLAEEARQLADRMDQLRRGDPSMPQEPARRLLEAADRAERAARNIERGETQAAARGAAQAEKQMSDANAGLEQSVREMDRDSLKGAAADAEEIAREQADLARESSRSARKEREERDERERREAAVEAGDKTAEDAGQEARRQAEADAARLAERQEGLAKRMENLEGKVSSLAENAADENRPEARALAQADMRQKAAGTSGLMREAADQLRDGLPQVAEGPQQIAALSAESLAEDLRRAVAAAERAGREDVAEAIRRAEELAKQIRRVEEDAADAARDTAPAAAQSRELAQEAEDLSGLTTRLPARGRTDDLKSARESLDRTGRRLGDAAKALDMKDRAGGSEASRDAREEAERAAAALWRSAAADLAKDLAAARDAASAAAREQKDARESAEASRDAQAEEAKGASRQGAARSERDAERDARESAERLASAADAAQGVGSELASWISREAERARREGLPGRMGELASKLESPAPEEREERGEEAAKRAREASDLERAARDAAGRFDSLVAEAKGDDLEALRATGEDAKEMAERLRELDRQIGEFRKGEARAAGREGNERGERRRELGQEARDTAEDSKSLRERVERRAGDVLRPAPGEPRDGKGIEKDMDEAAMELEKLERALSRNQTLPKPSNALESAAEAYQIVGDGIIAKVERILREREYRPPEDEEAPEEFRDLVDRYFRALSEDH